MRDLDSSSSSSMWYPLVSRAFLLLLWLGCITYSVFLIAVTMNRDHNQTYSAKVDLSPK